MCFLFLSLRLSPGKIIGAGLVFVGGGIGGTILYAKWDSHFRESVEKTIPYSDKLFEMVLGSLTLLLLWGQSAGLLPESPWSLRRS